MAYAFGSAQLQAGLAFAIIAWLVDALALLLAGIAVNLYLAYASRTEVVATLHVLLSLLPVSPQLYPDDSVTDETLEDRISEIIREALQAWLLSTPPLPWASASSAPGI